jgi:CRP-like cAMP-binding protein
MHAQGIAEITQFIQRVVPVPTDEIEAFCQRAAPKHLARHEVFVREGEVCEHLLFIHSGLLRYAFLAEGEEHTKDFAVDGHLQPFLHGLHQLRHGAALGDQH